MIDLSHSSEHLRPFVWGDPIVARLF
jgi:hypothetical protein